MAKLRENQARLSARDAALTFVLATGLAAAMLVLLSFVLQRGVRARLRAEDALRRTEKLAASGRMAATIAHEVNNPMEAIKNSMYLLKGKVTPEAETVYEILTSETQRVARMRTIPESIPGGIRPAIRGWCRLDPSGRRASSLHWRTRPRTTSQR